MNTRPRTMRQAVNGSIIILLLALPLGLVAAQGPAIPSAAGNLGSQAALAASPYPEVPLAGELPAPAGAEAPLTWVLERVDAPKLFAHMGSRSLALDAAGYPHIAYGKDFLYYARYDGSQWQIETVDDSPAVGRWTSLALDAAGRPHVSYYDSTNDDLKYAGYDGTSWQITTVDSAGDVGSYSSLALDAFGRPHISYCYYDDIQGACVGLRYAHYDGSAWITATVDSAGDVGADSALVLDAAGRPAISYYDATNQALKFAWHDGDSWHLERVDGGGGMYTSLALDAAGRPHISYQGRWSSGDEDELRYAYHDGTTWITTTVDSAGSAGWYTSLALDATGQPRIGYCESEVGGVLYYCVELRYASFDGTSWVTATVDLGGAFTSLALDAAGRPRITSCPYSTYSDRCRSLQYATYDGTSWTTETVDDEADRGRYTSLALDAAARPHVSYCDWYRSYQMWYCQALRYAHYDGISWHLETVDMVGGGGGWLGWDSSLALDTDGRPHISYFDSGSGGALKYAYYDGASWQIESIDGAANLYDSTSLALDADGHPHIGYAGPYTGMELKYAHYDGSAWQLATVDAAGGGDVSLALDAAGDPHLSYYDRTNGDLKYARWAGSSWAITVVDSAGDVGQYTALVLDAAGRPHVSYYDNANGDLKYAYYDGAAWQIETVDSAGDVGQYTSLALDAAGRPHMSYYDYTNGDLKYAYYDGAVWQIEVVDGVESAYTSLALDAFGQPHISYYDAADADLKYAHALCVQVAAVTVEGPPVLLVDQLGTYRAAVLPITATRPLTFTWDNGSSGPTAAYSWPATGTYTLTVTATNACGGSATASRTVTVLAEWPYGAYLPLVLHGDPR